MDWGTLLRAFRLTPAACVEQRNRLGHHEVAPPPRPSEQSPEPFVSLCTTRALVPLPGSLLACGMVAVPRLARSQYLDSHPRSHLARGRRCVRGSATPCTRSGLLHRGACPNMRCEKRRAWRLAFPLWGQTRSWYACRHAQSGWCAKDGTREHPGGSHLYSKFCGTARHTSLARPASARQPYATSRGLAGGRRQRCRPGPAVSIFAPDPCPDGRCPPLRRRLPSGSSSGTRWRPGALHPPWRRPTAPLVWRAPCRRYTPAERLCTTHHSRAGTQGLGRSRGRRRSPARAQTSPRSPRMNPIDNNLFRPAAFGLIAAAACSRRVVAIGHVLSTRVSHHRGALNSPQPLARSVPPMLWPSRWAPEPCSPRACADVAAPQAGRHRHAPRDPRYAPPAPAGLRARVPH